MKLILDSNVLIWSLRAPQEISAPAAKALESKDVVIFFSAASIWEIEIKISQGKLKMPASWQGKLPELGLTELRIDSVDATTSAQLPLHHRDPFDRMIVAQALIHGLTVVTRDTFLATYGIPVIAA